MSKNKGAPQGACCFEGCWSGRLLAQILNRFEYVIDVTGYTLDAAVREMEELGLTVEPVDDASCTATDPRIVRSQSLAPGEAPVRSTIQLASCSAVG